MITVYHESVPYLSTEQMREVDWLMIVVYHIQLIQMMENAGRNLERVARERFLDGDPTGKEVVVLAGSGGNGGGALVCARWLHNSGAHVRVWLSSPATEFRGVPAQQLAILEQMNISIDHVHHNKLPQSTDILIDGIIGYSLRGIPSGIAADLIQQAHLVSTPILSLDVPSGIDATTGEVFDPAIRATATMTLALPKIGLRAAREYVGELFLANIGVPPGLYAHPSLNLHVDHIFRFDDIVQLPEM
jgi:NAD(P)H-hydrate epimerase